MNDTNKNVNAIENRSRWTWAILPIVSLFSGILFFRMLDMDLQTSVVVTIWAITVLIIIITILANMNKPPGGCLNAHVENPMATVTNVDLFTQKKIIVYIFMGLAVISTLSMVVAQMNLPTGESFSGINGVYPPIVGPGDKFALPIDQFLTEEDVIGINAVKAELIASDGTKTEMLGNFFIKEPDKTKYKIKDFSTTFLFQLPDKTTSRQHANMKVIWYENSSSGNSTEDVKNERMVTVYIAEPLIGEKYVLQMIIRRWSFLASVITVVLMGCAFLRCV